jgi:hypothetical protein
VKVIVYRTAILPVVLYWCKIWFPALREKHRLREFENKVLRRVFGPKREEVTEAHGHGPAERVRKIKKKNSDLVENQTLDLPAYSIVLQLCSKVLNVLK